MEEYASNSHKSKEAKVTDKKVVQKVVTGAATTKKKSEVQKFADVFISEDIENVKSYVLSDVLIPAVKKAISDIVVNGIDMLLYGEAGRNRKNSGGTKISYRDYYSKSNDTRRANTGESSTRRSIYDYDNILFNSRGDAEAVLEEMDELISMYGIASVMDLYSAAGLQCDYTYNKYGWTDISTAKTVPVRDGFMIKLPKAMLIS